MFKKLVNVLLVLGIMVLIGLGLKELSLYYRVEQDNETLQEEVIKVPDNTVLEGDDETKMSEEDPNYLDPNDPFNRFIDFEALESINPDIKGWVYIPDTMVDYPILVGETDEKYLHADYKGNYSYAGAIFAFSDVDLKTNPHICLFGHNMASRQMFGSLRDYDSESFGKGHTKCYIYTPDRTKECDLISVFTCQNTDSVFELNALPEADAYNVNLRDTLVSRSSYKLNAPEGLDQIVTLATCHGLAGGTTRLTVNFQVVKEKYVFNSLTGVDNTKNAVILYKNSK